jgi:butyrate kinase
LITANKNIETLKIVAINLGSTSTKIAYYVDTLCQVQTTLPHSTEKIAGYSSVWEQYDLRKTAIDAFLKDQGINPRGLSAFVSRGGHTQPLTGGTYRITPAMLEQSASEKYGNHVSDLGIKLAYDYAAEIGCLPLTVDTPATDEFGPLARYSGLPEIQRESHFHALNHKAVARRFAQDTKSDYESLNLIVCHMGGGTTVAAHRQGKMIDATNGLDGDGPFSTNRTGALPVGALVNLCYSGQYTHKEMHRKINGMGGMIAYLGETDMRVIEEKAKGGDERFDEVTEAMCYQTAKEIGAMATVLCGKVDAILFTGGIAYSDYVMDKIIRRVEHIAPVKRYPGEFEMESLCSNAYRALIGQIEIKTIDDTEWKHVSQL